MMALFSSASCPRCSHSGALSPPGRRTMRVAAHRDQHAASAAFSGSALALATLVATAASAGPALADALAPTAPANTGWLAPIVDGLDYVLSNIETVYLNFGVPYSYGWSIVTLTAFVKIITLPLTKKQVESAMSVQNLKPRIDIIKERYGEDKEKVQKETSRLYEAAKVNPLAGCGPSILSLPIFLGLYRSLSNIANSGALDAQGFYWVPSLAGPVALSTRDSGAGISWLYPLVDGAPPVGWETAGAYCVLPVLLVAAQIVSSLVISPVDPNQENATTQKVLIYALPFMLGYFALTVPSGLSLYYFSNSVFTSAQQIYFRKLGGANIDTPDLGPVTKLGMGRRQGAVVAALPSPAPAAALPSGDAASAALAAEFGDALPAVAMTTNGAGDAAADAPMEAVPAFGETPEAAVLVGEEWMLENARRCKRKKRVVATA